MIPKLELNLLTLSDIKSGSFTNLLWIFDKNYGGDEEKILAKNKPPFGLDHLSIFPESYSMNLSDVSYDDIKNIRLGVMNKVLCHYYRTNICNDNYYDALVDFYGEDFLSAFIFHDDKFTFKFKIIMTVHSVLKESNSKKINVVVDRFSPIDDSDINTQIYNAINENFNILKQEIGSKTYQYTIASKEDK